MNEATARMRESTIRSYGRMNQHMDKTGEAVRRVTANLPVALLEEARRVTGKGITETLTAGLLLVRRTAAAKMAARLNGNLRLRIDLETSRERPRR